MSFDPIVEDVPEFVRRSGDTLFQGSNNTTVILGTDRLKAGAAKISDGLGHTGASGKGQGTGTIHLIAGRKGEDPNASDDLSYIYVTMKSDIDKNMGTDGIEGKTQSGPAVGVKSDYVRFYSRKDTKISVKDSVYIYMTSDDLIVMQANKIKLGKDAKEKLVKGSTYRDAESQLHTKLKSYLDSMQTSTRAAATSLNAGGTAAVGPLAPLQTAFQGAGAALQAIAALIGQCSSAIQTFENDAQKYLSEVSTTL